MRLVVADTSPIFYLLSIDQITLLPQLFGTVFVPDAVYAELTHPSAPPSLRAWADQPPVWLQVASVSPIDDETFRALGAGERAAITLALSMHADLILIDERKGTKAAINKGFDVTGTLGILRMAAMRLSVAISMVPLFSDCSSATTDGWRQTTTRRKQRNDPWRVPSLGSTADFFFIHSPASDPTGP